MDHNYIKLEHGDIDRKEWFVVNWCLGNTCNFSCSYCPDNLHNGSVRWPDLNKVKNFISKVMAQIAPRKVYFEFTGGEVTLYKDFTEVCKHATSLGARVGLISNASRTVRWWTEHKQYFDHVCVSFHPEFSDENHFIEVIKLLHNDVRTHVNIMMSPDKFDHCYAVANKIKNLENISMALQPLIHNFQEEVFDYSVTQKHIFDKQHELLTKHIKYTRDFDIYRGAMKTVQEDGTGSVSSAHRFISTHTNDWSGWKCSAGVEQIIVDMEGFIYRGWCKVGNIIGNINEIDIQLPTEPVICNKTMCHCNFDIMSTKEK